MNGRFAAIAAALLCGWFVRPAAADPQPMSAGAAPVPSARGAMDIAIAREQLAIDLTRTAAQVVAELWLENGGGATTLQVGFPCSAKPPGEVVALACKSRPEVRVDGKRVALKLTGKGDERNWIWTMRFAAAGRARIEVRYTAPLVNDRYERPFFGMAALVYRLTTGAAWAGPIKQLDMEARLPTDALVHISPAGYTRAPGQVSWHFIDHEPHDDVALFFHPIHLGRAAKALPAASYTELTQLLEQGRFSGTELQKVARELRADVGGIEKYVQFFQGMSGLSAAAAGDAAAVRRCVEESAGLMEAEAKRAVP